MLVLVCMFNVLLSYTTKHTGYILRSCWLCFQSLSIWSFLVTHYFLWQMRLHFSLVALFCTNFQLTHTTRNKPDLCVFPIVYERFVDTNNIVSILRWCLVCDTGNCLKLDLSMARASASSAKRTKLTFRTTRRKQTLEPWLHDMRGWRDHSSLRWKACDWETQCIPTVLVSPIETSRVCCGIVRKHSRYSLSHSEMWREAPEIFEFRFRFCSFFSFLEGGRRGWGGWSQIFGDFG